ncbi:MAG TPA: hypothetical protein VH025_05205 [Solirubrobacteraceae bacterium]|nr:hypothetical protein [Solirubrobacteraceae bacterium]
MEIGGFFLLIIVFFVLTIVGGGVYAIAARLRQKQLSPEGDQIEGRDGKPSRPQHHEVVSEQQTNFVGKR